MLHCISTRNGGLALAKEKGSDTIMQTEAAMARIIIVEDNNVVRSSLEELVNSIPGCECVGCCASGEEGLKLIPRLKPDLVMMLSQGLSNKEIAEHLGINVETVR